MASSHANYCIHPDLYLVPVYQESSAGSSTDGDAENARNENTRHENAAPKIRGENEKSET